MTRTFDAALAALEGVARAGALESFVAGEFAADGERHAIRCYRLRGADRGQEPIRLGLFAGIHGDEPAGVLALSEFAIALARAPELAMGYELFVYPIVNPTGCADGTRANRRGRDLNREFWQGSAEPEVRIVERELRERTFAGIVSLHADDTCEGHYGYSHGRALDDALLRPALLAAERVLPRDRRCTIDGFTAREGVLSECFTGILSPPAEQHPQPFNVIFETPARELLDLQVRTNVAALEAMLATYRGLIAYAQNI